MPARSAVGVSRRLYASSPTAALADAHDRDAQRIDKDPHMLTAQETGRRVKPHPALISYQ